MATGEFVYFGGSELDSEKTAQFALPPSVIPNVLKITDGSLVLLSDGATFYIDGQDDEKDGIWDEAYEYVKQFDYTLVDIVSGGKHWLCLTDQGQVLSFGSNSYGQLGLGHTRGVVEPTLLKAFAEGLAKQGDYVVQVAAGDMHSLALTAQGSVYAWGRGVEGQCGNGGSTLTSPRFVYKLQSMNMTRICAGAQSSAAISSKGKLYVWGSNISQQKHSLPFEVPFPLKTKIVDVDAGYSHMLALSSKGEVFSWGVGSFGQLGHGSAKEQMKLQAPTPLFVPAQPSFASTHAVAHGKPPLSGRGSIGANGKETIKKGGNAVKFARVFCGAFYSALLSRDGNVYTFGNGSYGKLGHGSASHSEASGGGMHVSTPQLVVSLANKPVSQIACGKRRMLCFMQTTLSALSLSTCPVVGGSDLLLTGYGVYDTGLQLQVQFTLCTRSSGGGNVTQRGSPVIVPGVFDSVSNGVRCKSPSFRALVQTLKDQFQCDDSNNSNINDNVNDNVYSADLQYIAYVSVSLDESPRFSNALPIHVFEDSAQYSQATVDPVCGPYGEDTDVVLAADFTLAPYDNVLVRFTSQESPTSSPSSSLTPTVSSIMPATYDLSTNTIRFKTPTLPSPSSPSSAAEAPLEVMDTSLEVSLDGQQFTPLHTVFSFYQMKVTSVMPSVLPYTGGSVKLGVAGVHFIDRISVRFQVCGDSSKEFIVPGQFLPSQNDSSSGIIECHTPSFEVFGECFVTLAVTLNGQNYKSVDAIDDSTGEPVCLQIKRPQPTQLVPACGPIEGGTDVRLFGEQFFSCSSISVKLQQQHKKSKKRSNSIAGSTADEESKIDPVAPIYLNAKYGVDMRERTDADKEADVDLNGLVATEYVTFVAPPAIAKVGAGPAAFSVAFRPSANAYSQEPLNFVFYKTPEVNEIVNNQVPLTGGTEVKMGGKGLIESSTIKIRLSVHAEDLELIREKESRERERERMIREKEREKQARALASQQRKTSKKDTSDKSSKAQSRRGRGGKRDSAIGKKDKDKKRGGATAGSSSNTNADDIETIPERDHEDEKKKMKDGDVSGDAAAAVNEEEEDTFVDEEPETLIVDGTWQSNKSLNDDDVDHSHDKHSKRGGRGKGKSRRPKAKDVDDDDVYDPSTISFTAPPAAAFGYWMREGACQVLIEVALDGQNYVSTNQLIKYESNVKLQKKKR